MPPPVNQTRQPPALRPSTTRQAYSQDMRDLAMQVALNGEFHNPVFHQL